MVFPNLDSRHISLGIDVLVDCLYHTRLAHQLTLQHIFKTSLDLLLARHDAVFPLLRLIKIT